MGHTPSPKDHPRLPSTDPLWHLLLKCWSENPGKRPTMDAVLQEVGSSNSFSALRAGTELTLPLPHLKQLESEKDRRAALGN